MAEGEVTRENMVEFVKLIKRTTDLTDEEASLLAASKVHDSLPKSRMYYKIEASRNMGGGKKFDPSAEMSDKLKKIKDDVNSGALTKKAEEEEDLAVIGDDIDN